MLRKEYDVLENAKNILTLAKRSATEITKQQTVITDQLKQIDIYSRLLSIQHNSLIVATCIQFNQLNKQLVDIASLILGRIKR